MAGVWQVQRKLNKDELSGKHEYEAWQDCHHGTCRGYKPDMQARLRYMQATWPEETYRMVKLGKV